MKIGWTEYKIKGKKIQAKVTIPERQDKDLLKNLYARWKSLNDDLKAISTRGINLPETISENAFCLFGKNYVRVVSLKKGKCSYDVLNTKTGSRIQVKATSIGSDLTSFGPRSEWDELFFLDFSAGDGSFKVYKIEADWIYKHQVNKKQTFEQQQAEKRRPRFSIIDGIIKPRKLKPVAICKL
jgi:hypothetical protein